MQLQFTTVITKRGPLKNWATGFIPKILAAPGISCEPKYQDPAAFVWRGMGAVKPKKHSIRGPRVDGIEWKTGMPIQFCAGAMKAGQVRVFARGECKGTQQVQLKAAEKKAWVDGRLLADNETTLLAENDGFPTVEMFFQWFSYKEFVEATIVHWTDFRY